MIKSVELNEVQIWIIVETCREKRNYLEGILNNAYKLEPEQLEEAQERLRDLSDIIRHLQFYYIDQEKEK